MNDIIGVIETIEDDSYQGKEFKKVTLKDGQVLKVKYGREGLLKAKWGELQAGTAFKFTMGTYQNHPFVQDFQAIEGELPDPTKPPLADTDPPQVNVDTKIRSMALSYSKDMVVSGQVNLGDIGLVAMQLERYMLGFLDSKQLDANLKAILKN